MSYDVVGLGSAVVDVLVRVDDSFFKNTPFVKGGYSHLSEADILYFIENLPNKIILPGGSSANTITCAASLGMKTGFVCSVKTDTLGRRFLEDLEKSHVDFLALPREEGESTGQSLILVTDDGDRSMNSYLGITLRLTPDDVHDDFIKNAKILYTEAYLWEPDLSQEALRKAACLCKKYGTQLALTLSDQFYMKRHAAAIFPFIRDYVDILVGNLGELQILVEKEGEAALETLRDIVPFAAITNGKHGSYIVTPETVTHIDRYPVDAIVDTTGAGDAYASGILYGTIHKMSIHDMGALASRVASDIITHLGSRPQKSFKVFLNHPYVKESTVW
jgi:sugar/nucleoside kinase (ribokinase family)